ncbi:urease accessory protein UreD [Endozoicomonas sp. 8E]|uniref:urease accessory protein UreD n=1 Tax=Endozoicomonas sp. 8E TaxID=3035692 RepID=UPI0029392922|nr:urease accessory protein UreD [Endozoicomonas sp. 8E]WOG28670.1 urease accessory protein UreD [Endozoicomonas sp. 8E]
MTFNIKGRSMGLAFNRLSIPRSIPRSNPDTDSDQDDVASGGSGWRAGIAVELKYMDGHTRMGRSRHYGPLRIQRPFWPEGKDLAHLYVLHPPGGLVAGDELIQSFEAHSGASGLVTTPAAGKVYFNGNGRLQKQLTSMVVQEGACLEWLPQETIIFNGAEAELNTSVELRGNGCFAGWDIVCLGRKASGEAFKQGRVIQNLQLTRNDQPLYRERLELAADSPLTQSVLGLNGQHVFGTLIMTLEKDPGCDHLHERLEAQGGSKCAAITWRNGVFIARYLGSSPEQARTLFAWLWNELRSHLNGRQGCKPRIWNT